MRSLLAFKIFFLVTFALVAGSENAYNDRNFEEFINAYMVQNKIVGLGLGILVRNNRTGTFNTEHLKGYGYQDREKGIGIHPNISLFRWASWTKTITSTIAFMQKREGRLDFDTNISKYYRQYNCPSNFTRPCAKNQTYFVYNNTSYKCQNNSFAYIPLPERERYLTLRDLLSHRAGIIDYANGEKSPVPPGINDPLENLGVEWAVTYMKDLALVEPPRTSFNYTSFGFNLAGEVLVKNSKYFNRYDDMVVYYMGIPKDKLIVDYHWLNYKYPNRCKGYNNLVQTGDNDVSYKLPGGGYMSTLSFGVEYWKNVFENKYMTPSEQKEAWNDAYGNSYGLGFQLYNDIFDPRTKGVGHPGNQEKTKNIAVYFNSTQTLYVVMSNSENFRDTHFIDAVRSYRPKAAQSLKFLQE